MTPPGPRSRELAARAAAVESPAFEARRAARGDATGSDHSAIVYDAAAGANVVDADGNLYVDLTAGFGAMILGHRPMAAHDMPLALGDVYPSRDKVEALEAIASLFPEAGARVMLGLSGADAVTCALKTALLATGKPGVVAFHGSYHGLSHGPLAALGFAPSFRTPFAAHLGIPVQFAPFPSETGSGPELDASLSVVRAAALDAGAILVEPILGRGGIVEPPASFMGELRSIADDTGALLVVDEIWTGMGRTGEMLASGVLPDVLCLGKGLGGGAPISACVGRASIMAAWGGHGGTRIHTGTHFGSPPSCAAATRTIGEVRTMLPRVREVGDAWRAALSRVAEAKDRAMSVRGRGLMVGIELGDPNRALRVMRALLERGYLVLTGGGALTLSPPLTIATELLEAFTNTLAEVLDGSRA